MHAGTLTGAELIPPGSKRYEKPELTGEDARKELDATGRMGAELTGEDARKELDATERRGAELRGDEPRMELDATVRRV